VGRGQLVVVALFALLGGGAAGRVTTPAEATMMDVLLTRADNGRTVDLKVGADATLRLPENPTTGYRWAIDAADANLVEIKEGQFVSSSSTAAGAGGEAQWLIEAKAPGATEIRLKYWRPWEGDSTIADKFAVTVRISR